MADDDLDKPLGLEKKTRRTPGSSFAPLVLWGLGCLCVATFAFLELRGDPFGGEPHAVALLEKAPSQPQTRESLDRAAATDPAQHGAATSTPSVETALQVEDESGVKVVRPAGTAPPGAMIIDVPRALGTRLAPAPDRRLVEKSRYGLLPRIGPDGARSADVYARPLVTALGKTSGPRIVLVVGGMGLSQASTAAAIAMLPPAVTVAFAPYGNELEADAARARDSGHEIILQLPMEPIDYPTLNPGPHALVTSASKAQNIEDLHWLLGRFTGYVGVGNFLGGKFTADNEAMGPILREIAARGLFYFDDGTSPRSVAASLAADFNLSALKADLVLDAPARPEAIDIALTKLEAIARQKGLAIGTASGLPVSLERIGRFARDAESRGLTLIPLSAARNLANSSADAHAQDTPH
jgi:polysaccharide deacetylase 2 family uncharacterized protein YibQ